MALEARQNHFLILGPNGAGLTTALDVFTDLGCITVGGIHPERLLETLQPLMQGPGPAAASLRLSADTDTAALAEAIRELKRQQPDLKVLLLDAPEDLLIKRYLKSEKRHPFEAAGLGGLQQAIAAEAKLYEPLKKLKDHHIDTSTHTASELRLKIAKILGRPMENQELTVYIVTFGFKYGIPQDVELMFDMRFLTNPYYDEALRPLTGQDRPVRDFIFNLPHARQFFDDWAALVAGMLPLYQAEGKTRLSVAVGCTGGKHRSVCMGEALAVYLKHACPSFSVVISHREMLRWNKPVENVKQTPQSPTCPVGESS